MLRSEKKKKKDRLELHLNRRPVEEDYDRTHCSLCGKKFKAFRTRRHECRSCWRTVCDACSGQKVRVVFDNESSSERLSTAAALHGVGDEMSGPSGLVEPGKEGPEEWPGASAIPQLQPEGGPAAIRICTACIHHDDNVWYLNGVVIDEAQAQEILKRSKSSKSTPVPTPAAAAGVTSPDGTGGGGSNSYAQHISSGLPPNPEAAPGGSGDQIPHALLEVPPEKQKRRRRGSFLSRVANLATGKSFRDESNSNHPVGSSDIPSPTDLGSSSPMEESLTGLDGPSPSSGSTPRPEADFSNISSSSSSSSSSSRKRVLGIKLPRLRPGRRKSPAGVTTDSGGVSSLRSQTPERASPYTKTLDELIEGDETEEEEAEAEDGDTFRSGYYSDSRLDNIHSRNRRKKSLEKAAVTRTGRRTLAERRGSMSVLANRPHKFSAAAPPPNEAYPRPPPTPTQGNTVATRPPPGLPSALTPSGSRRTRRFSFRSSVHVDEAGNQSSQHPTITTTLATTTVKRGSGRSSSRGGSTTQPSLPRRIRSASEFPAPPPPPSLLDMDLLTSSEDESGPEFDETVLGPCRSLTRGEKKTLVIPVLSAAHAAKTFGMLIFILALLAGLGWFWEIHPPESVQNILLISVGSIAFGLIHALVDPPFVAEG